MTRTDEYTALHNAFAKHAPEGVAPFTMRVLMALYDYGAFSGAWLTSQKLELILGLGDGASIRRALGEGYAAALIRGRGVDGGRRRPGVVSDVTLTDAGFDLVEKLVNDALDR